MLIERWTPPRSETRSKLMPWALSRKAARCSGLRSAARSLNAARWSEVRCDAEAVARRCSMRERRWSSHCWRSAGVSAVHRSDAVSRTRSLLDCPAAGTTPCSSIQVWTRSRTACCWPGSRPSYQCSRACLMSSRSSQHSGFSSTQIQKSSSYQPCRDRASRGKRSAPSGRPCRSRRWRSRRAGTPPS